MAKCCENCLYWLPYICVRINSKHYEECEKRNKEINHED